MYVSLNNALYREVRSDYPSDIFPKAACKRTNLGDGDTFFSVEQIVIAIDTYYTQCQKIAKLLKGNTLQATCRNIHQFLYHHFQYKADSEVQQLRSPACSWAQRFIGIDCKSYTILAGSIIKALGYNSYVRQIKQPYSAYPDQYTHVYLVVPTSQKDNDLRKGYYVIDGTVPTTKEALYSEKADEIVTAMKHIGLNGAQNALYGFTTAKGLRGIGSGKSYEEGKFHKTTDTIGKAAGDVGNVLKAGKGIYDDLTRKNPDPTNPPARDYSSDIERNQAEAALKRQEAERLRLENDERRRQLERQNKDQGYDNQNTNQGYTNNHFVPQGNAPQGQPKDNTMIYVIGGVAVVGLLVVVLMMNKKK